MLDIFRVTLLATCVSSLTHHFASTKKYIFGSRPSAGTLTRYLVAPTYELLNEGTMEIPFSCNTTNFRSLHLSSSSRNLGIWGTASTGICSVLFGITSDGYTTIRSKEIVGDIHSLAWSPSGRSLHALDSSSSASSTTSITNFRITDTPNLEDVTGIDVLSNVSSASQIVSHPTGDWVYVVTRDTNELVTVSLQESAQLHRNATLTPSRHKLLPLSLDASQFHTTSLAITASRTSLWALSQSSNQAVITAFGLNVTTGEVIGVAARASWKGAGEGLLTAAPFEAGDMVAITNSPVGYVTILGLDSSSLTVANEPALGSEHDFLQPIAVTAAKRSGIEASSAKVKSYGRVILEDFLNVGEGVWID
ncbi:hypothetical protein BKA66DRAFT_516673 [Pyrenochaeta sp. MPI-SDFR-AT-0127]|nr:hypothetical protein BKA66DRAFT_516673 [Pyrenochaeta sp. MPI-SDFR-AT-0127]